MQNHTNAAVAIQQRIAEKFIGIRTAPLKYKPSISSIDTQNFSQELEDVESESEVSESENFDIMYNAEVQDNVNKEKKEEVQDNVNMKESKISDESRMEIENAYMKMKKDAMWKLSNGKFVEELYNRKKSRIRIAPDLSQDVIDYLNKFINVTSTNKVRSIIGEQDDRLNANYDSSKHHDLDYIRFVLYTITREIENGGLKQPNLESWYNCHVWNAIVDHGFGDIKGLSIVRGESACVATATRKNSKRITTQRRQMGRRGDWILRMSGNGDCDEYGMGEVGKKWEGEFGKLAQL
ncbi:hypothetical protein F8M41_023487 [Gigaspora margarita]|uniref:Uncharacterized protein n=1 Tax=Gigaspora margarita TaxID=4874 RepID=A0A8H4AD98_GIGMA|nr:hypothetical protein F8M41_023487 [Gigaspora margarita]